MYSRVIVCHDISLFNELIEEAAKHRELIFGMWESFGYGSTKFCAQTKMSAHHGIMTSLSPFYNQNFSFSTITPF